MNKPSIFVVYGNMDRDFLSLSKMVCDFNELGYKLTVQYGYSNINCLTYLENAFAFCDENEFRSLVSSHDLVLSHAGVGVISAVLANNKMPIVVPRRASLNEHINDHQVDFVDHFKKDNIFIQVDGAGQFLEVIQSGMYLNKPSRTFITDINPLKLDLHNFLNAID